MVKDRDISVANRLEISLTDDEFRDWNVEISRSKKAKSFGVECLGNAKFEAICIGACELGEFLGEVAAYNAIRIHEYVGQTPFLGPYAEYVRDNMNETGLLAALVFGGVYAFSHTLKHAKGLPKIPATIEAGKVTATTEIACVGSASFVQYLVSKFVNLASTLDPLNLINLGVRTGGVPFAFGMGTAAMSYMTRAKRKESGRFIAPKSNLNEIAYTLRDEGYNVILTEKGRYGVPEIEIDDGNEHTRIIEERLPGIYKDKFDLKSDSLYRVMNPTAMYSESARNGLENLTTELLRRTNGRTDTDYTKVVNPFAPHSHVNRGRAYNFFRKLIERGDYVDPSANSSPHSDTCAH